MQPLQLPLSLKADSYLLSQSPNNAREKVFRSSHIQFSYRRTPLQYYDHAVQTEKGRTKRQDASKLICMSSRLVVVELQPLKAGNRDTTPQNAALQGSLGCKNIRMSIVLI